jgi:hypothetical protein
MNKSTFLYLLWAIFLLSFNSVGQEKVKALVVDTLDEFIDGPCDLPEVQIAKQPNIVFPKELQSLAKVATVYFQVSLDSSSNVLKTEIIKSSHKQFEIYALDLIKEYKFTVTHMPKGASVIKLSLPIRFIQ